MNRAYDEYDYQGQLDLLDVYRNIEKENGEAVAEEFLEKYFSKEDILKIHKDLGKKETKTKPKTPSSGKAYQNLLEAKNLLEEKLLRLEGRLTKMESVKENINHLRDYSLSKATNLDINTHAQAKTRDGVEIDMGILDWKKALDVARDSNRPVQVVTVDGETKEISLQDALACDFDMQESARFHYMYDNREKDKEIRHTVDVLLQSFPKNVDMSSVQTLQDSIRSIRNFCLDQIDRIQTNIHIVSDKLKTIAGKLGLSKKEEKKEEKERERESQVSFEQFNDGQKGTLRQIYHNITNKQGKEKAEEYLQRYFSDDDIEEIHQFLGVGEKKVDENNDAFSFDDIDYSKISPESIHKEIEKLENMDSLDDTLKERLDSLYEIQSIVEGMKKKEDVDTPEEEEEQVEERREEVDNPNHDVETQPLSATKQQSHEEYLDSLLKSNQKTSNLDLDSETYLDSMLRDMETLPLDSAIMKYGNLSSNPVEDDSHSTKWRVADFPENNIDSPNKKSDEELSAMLQDADSLSLDSAIMKYKNPSSLSVEDNHSTKWKIADFSENDQKRQNEIDEMLLSHNQDSGRSQEDYLDSLLYSVQDSQEEPYTTSRRR